jgi:hypothetical protein
MLVQVELRMSIWRRLRTFQGVGSETSLSPAAGQECNGRPGSPDPTVVAENCPRTHALRGEGVRHGGVSRENAACARRPNCQSAFRSDGVCPVGRLGTVHRVPEIRPASPRPAAPQRTDLAVKDDAISVTRVPLCVISRGFIR